MQKGEGSKYHLLAMAVDLLIFFKGSGALSLDYIWCAHRVAGGASASQLLSAMTHFLT